MTELTLKNAVNSLYEQIDIENQRHEKRIKKLESDIDKFRRACDHSETRYYPDPSGNNDSESMCLICGKTVQGRFRSAK